METKANQELLQVIVDIFAKCGTAEKMTAILVIRALNAGTFQESEKDRYYLDALRMTEDQRKAEIAAFLGVKQ